MLSAPTPQDLKALFHAREAAWRVLHQSAQLLRPGMTEKAAREIVQARLNSAGMTEFWHAPKIRFGKETLKSFSEPADQSVVLHDRDIFFLDLGPVLGGFEADVGETFVLGSDSEYLHLKKASRAIFDRVADHWRKNRINGPDLYRFATQVADSCDVKLEPQKAGGHILAEFPHRLKHRGGMSVHTDPIIQGVWVLEIQISSRRKPVGAFFEDLLF